MSNASAQLIACTSLKVGDYLPSWRGNVVAIRDTKMRRHITVERANGLITEWQDKATRIFAAVA